MTNAQQRILEQLERGQLALFIGADLPHELTGLPNRADMARELARRKGLAESPRLAEVAQRVGQGGNRFEFTAFIRDALDTAGSLPQPFHHRVIEVVQERQIKTIITTAYDDLLKRAFQDAGAALNYVTRSGDLQFIDPQRPTLIKLYGDAQQVDTLVVTEDDHLGLWRDRAKEDVLDEVRSVLRRNVILFLGYNLSDPDFNLLWREALDRAGRFRMGAYAVWPGLSATDVQMWRERGITILDTDPLGILDDVVVQPTPPSRPDAPVTAPSGTKSPAWNTQVMRQLLSAAFSDEELTRLCFDHFGPVYEGFGSGMGKGDKSQRLLDYCVRQRELETLARLVEEHNPAQYARFASRLRQKV